ncbi:MAG: hypothetical protein ACI9JN_001864, partial [Bacteroidia bacterium]
MHIKYWNEYNYNLIDCVISKSFQVISQKKTGRALVLVVFNLINIMNQKINWSKLLIIGMLLCLPSFLCSAAVLYAEGGDLPNTGNG